MIMHFSSGATVQVADDQIQEMSQEVVPDGVKDGFQQFRGGRYSVTLKDGTVYREVLATGPFAILPKVFMWSRHHG